MICSLKENVFCKRRIAAYHFFVQWKCGVVLLFMVVSVCAAQSVVESRPEYFLDVLVVADLPVYEAWFRRAQARDGLNKRDATLADIRTYFTLVIQRVNDRFRALERYTDFRLNIRPVDFYIAQTAAQSDWTVRSREGARGQVNAQRALQSLGDWTANSASVPDHDHAILFTGYDLVDRRENGEVYRFTIGRAGVGTMCRRGRSVSVVEDRGAFQSVQTATHELGHSLGARHDGTQNSCRAGDRFVMTPTAGLRVEGKSRNPWYFSPCSAEDISTFVNALRDSRLGSCLTTALPQNGVPDVQGLVPGQMFNADEQCQHIHGPKSRFCNGQNFGPLSDICTSMFCLNPANRTRVICTQHHAAHGTTCGDGKWCETGACVDNPNAPHLDLGACPFGDQLTLVNGERCEQAVRRTPALCYGDTIRSICCRSCQNLNNTGPQGCPLGDRFNNCRRAECQTLYPDGTPYGRDCCRTCRFDVTKPWTCADDPVGFEGRPCSEAVSQGQVQGCYNATLAFACCATCQGQRASPAVEGCEYGDLVPQSCRRITNNTNPCTQQQRAQCCSACRRNDANNNVTRNDDVTAISSASSWLLRHSDMFFIVVVVTSVTYIVDAFTDVLYL